MGWAAAPGRRRRRRLAGAERVRPPACAAGRCVKLAPSWDRRCKRLGVQARRKDDASAANSSHGHGSQFAAHDAAHGCSPGAVAGPQVAALTCRETASTAAAACSPASAIVAMLHRETGAGAMRAGSTHRHMSSTAMQAVAGRRQTQSRTAATLRSTAALIPGCSATLPAPPLALQQSTWPARTRAALQPQQHTPRSMQLQGDRSERPDGRHSTCALLRPSRPCRQRPCSHQQRD